ncbi:MAG: GAF domain-containing protein [Deltaproteobacteria bacterium]|nr:GAF domain-containing protein [Deltaproteobacteria bacterium]
MNISSDSPANGARPASRQPETENSKSDPKPDTAILRHIKKLSRIGVALSVEKDINKLLEMIVDETRDLTNADAGTLYILDRDQQCLTFQIMQNDTMQTRLGGTSGVDIELPHVPLYAENGEPNHSNVSSHVALTGETVNIPDVYEAEGFDFTGPRNYDASTGYRSKSMLVMALQNHENDIIGVLQLLNAQNPETRDVIAFSNEYVDLVASLASQAAVALTNTQLIQDLTDLFYSFIKGIATAIDEKSAYAGGHINRVVFIAMMIAEKINDSKEGHFKEFSFSKDEMEELMMAAWMHDVGKITTPEYVVDKATKLQTIFDRLELVESRFQVIEASIENNKLQQKIALLKKSPDDAAPALAEIEQAAAERISALGEDFEVIRRANTPGEFMNRESIEQIETIARKTYIRNGKKRPYLTENEVRNLCISKGTLTREERNVIENHAGMTLKILNELTFPRKFSRVPEFAAGHHEKLDGSGYPRQLTEKELALQTRILAVADIFEALTAKDRPYKKPMKLSQAVKILGFMVKDRHIDADIYDLVLQSDILSKYAKTHMDPDQVDDPDTAG